MASLLRHTAEGAIDLMVSEQSDCICCPDGHCFGMGITMDEYPGAWPYRDRSSPGDFAHDAVRSWWREHHYDLNGRRVRVTVELLDA